MPGLFGSFNFGEDSHEVIESMFKAMQTDDSFVQDDFFVDGNLSASRVHLGHVGMSTSPCMHDGVYVWVEGEAYNLRENCSSMQLFCNSFEQALAEAYVNGRTDAFLSAIDGNFCAALYDPEKKKLMLISDRYGMRMLYWYHKGNQFAWASEVKGILPLAGVDTTIDETSLQCFMDLGYLLGDHTWFKHIKLINPASVLEFDLQDNHLQHRYYWKWSEIKPLNISFDQAVKDMGELFLEAVNLRFNPEEKIGISLSGGLDSRAIIAAVCNLYPNYEGFAFTFGKPSCDDMKIAQQIIARTKWSHKLLYFSHDNWFDPRLEKIWNTDGMLDMMHMHGSEFIDEVSESVHINLNGYAGDVVCGGGWFPKIPLDKRGAKNNLIVFYGKHISLCDIENDFYDISHVEPHLYMNRVRRFTNMGTVNVSNVIEQRKPFFDNKLMEFVFSIPDEYRLNNKLYTAMLLNLFPEFFKNIPWQKTGRTINKPTTVVNEIVNKVKRIPSKLGITKNNTNYTNYPAWIRNDQIASTLTNLLCRKDSHYGLLVLDDYEEMYLLPHLKSQHINNVDKILRAATIEIYLRRVYS